MSTNVTSIKRMRLEAAQSPFLYFAPSEILPSDITMPSIFHGIHKRMQGTMWRGYVFFEDGNIIEVLLRRDKKTSTSLNPTVIEYTKVPYGVIEALKHGVKVP